MSNYYNFQTVIKTWPLDSFTYNPVSSKVPSSRKIDLVIQSLTLLKLKVQKDKSDMCYRGFALEHVRFPSVQLFVDSLNHLSKFELDCVLALKEMNYETLCKGVQIASSFPRSPYKADEDSDCELDYDSDRDLKLNELSTLTVVQNVENNSAEIEIDLKKEALLYFFHKLKKLSFKNSIDPLKFIEEVTHELLKLKNIKQERAAITDVAKLDTIWLRHFQELNISKYKRNPPLMAASLGMLIHLLPKERQQLIMQSFGYDYDTLKKEIKGSCKIEQEIIHSFIKKIFLEKSVGTIIDQCEEVMQNLIQHHVTLLEKPPQTIYNDLILPTLSYLFSITSLNFFSSSLSAQPEVLSEQPEVLKSQDDFFSNAPDELILNILSHLSYKKLRRLALVNKQFARCVVTATPQKQSPENLKQSIETLSNIVVSIIQREHSSWSTAASHNHYKIALFRDQHTDDIKWHLLSQYCDPGNTKACGRPHNMCHRWGVKHHTALPANSKSIGCISWDKELELDVFLKHNLTNVEFDIINSKIEQINRSKLLHS